MVHSGAYAALVAARRKLDALWCTKIMKAVSLIFGAILTLVSGLAAAETLTLSCQYKSRSDAGLVDAYQPYSRIDQIVIDTDKPMVQLRVANTIGTNHEEQYTWEGLDNKVCPKPQLQINPSGMISGAQQCGAPVSFYYTPQFHEFMVSILYFGSGAIFVWDCR
jgi:hypothetical protein